MPSNVALIDGDLVAFRCAAAAQEEIDGEIAADVQAAATNALKEIEAWTEAAQCDRVIIAFSPRDGGNFRKTLGSYKENRTGGKPVAYWATVDAIEAVHKVERIPMLEGDDVIGIMHTSDRFAGRSVAVSLDKDFQTIPGLIFNPAKDKAPRVNPKSAADRYWMYQTLIGDSADGYKGCPGVGPKKADALLDEPRVWVRQTKTKRNGKQETKWVQGDSCGTWMAVVSEYLRAGLTEEDALLQARMARILRRSDYNREEGTISLWHPNPRMRPTYRLTP